MLNRINSMICLALCWGVCALPFQGYVYAQETEPSIKTVFEITDVSGFWNRLQATSAFKGWNTDEMKKFADPIRAQISRTLDNAKAQFGLDIKAMANLLSGRVILEFDSAGESAVLFCRPKGPVSIDENIVLLKAALQKERMPFTEKEEKGVRILTVKSGGTCAIIYSKEKVVIGFSDKDITERLIPRFISIDPSGINSTADAYPALKGEGIKVHSETDFVFPDRNLNRTIEAANIPGLGGSISRTYVENDRIHGVSFVAQDMTKGVCSLLKKGAVSDETLSWAHESCRFAAAFHVDLSGIPAVIGSIVKATGKQHILQMYQGLLGQIQIMAGFSVESDLFAHLGDEMLLVSLPSGKAGGFPLISILGLNSLAAVIKLKDPEKFSQTADKISAVLSNLARMDRVNGGLRMQDHKGTAIKYIRAFCGALSPCFAIKNGYLVLTLNIPLMKHVLDLHGGLKITETGDFKEVSSISGNPLGSIFTYSKPVSETKAGYARSLANPFVGLGIASIITSILVPSLAKSRKSAKRIACKNNLRQIGLAMSMYAMDRDNAFPSNLASLYPDYVCDKRIFHCTSSEKPGNSYIYLTGLTVNAPSEAVVAFDKAENHGYEGRNVLYADAHVTWMRDGQFRNALKMMLKPRLRKHYDKKAIETINNILQGTPVHTGNPQPAKGTSGNSLAEAQLSKFTERNVEQFLINEGKKIGSAVDFAIFPMMGTFSGARKSNFTNVMLRDDGIYSRSHTGHFISAAGGGGGSSLMVTVAVIAIIAAIAIPSLIKSKISANEGAAAAGLKTFNGMMATYRKSDYDQNGVQDYPVKLCALYYEMNNAGERVTLIGIADAQADYGSGGTYTAHYTDRATGRIKTVTETFTPQSKAGYWFSMIPLMHDGKPYAENRRNHYAICAFPADYGDSGQVTFIINEEGTVYCMDFGTAEPIKKWPGPDPIAEGWEIAQ